MPLLWPEVALRRLDAAEEAMVHPELSVFHRLKVAAALPPDFA
jgi:hypothetical protein